MGELHVITGPMFSGKSSELINIQRACLLQGKSCLCFNHARDTRFGDGTEIVAHNRSAVSCESVRQVGEIIVHPRFADAECIFVDEVQFFDAIRNPIIRMVEAHKKKIYLAGLLVDVHRNLFGELHTLLGYADTVNMKTSASCSLCDKPGLFSKAIFPTNEAINVVGHSDKYTVLCRTHFLTHT